jgi:hypothetical protein
MLSLLQELTSIAPKMAHYYSHCGKVTDISGIIEAGEGITVCF